MSLVLLPAPCYSEATTPVLEITSAAFALLRLDHVHPGLYGLRPRYGHRLTYWVVDAEACWLTGRYLTQLAAQDAPFSVAAVLGRRIRRLLSAAITQHRTRW